MNSRKQLMRISLCESLRELMLHYPFEKITIKNICNETGVIRATFYNYFVDKYDCLSQIVYLDFVETVFKQHQHLDIDDLIYELLKIIAANKEFYRIALSIRDSAEINHILNDNLKLFLNNYLVAHDIKTDGNKQIFSEYYSYSLAFLINRWLLSDYNAEVSEIYEVYHIVENTSFNQVFASKK